VKSLQGIIASKYPVKILATSVESLGWNGEETFLLKGFKDKDLHSGVEVFLEAGADVRNMINKAALKKVDEEVDENSSAQQKEKAKEAKSDMIKEAVSRIVEMEDGNPRQLIILSQKLRGLSIDEVSEKLEEREQEIKRERGDEDESGDENDKGDGDKDDDDEDDSDEDNSGEDYWKKMQRLIQDIPGEDDENYTVCDICDKRITGIRNKCINCPDYDLCEKCIELADAQHPDHTFMQIRKAGHSKTKVQKDDKEEGDKEKGDEEKGDEEESDEEEGDEEEGDEEEGDEEEDDDDDDEDEDEDEEKKMKGDEYAKEAKIDSPRT